MQKYNAILSNFKLDGEIKSVSPYGNGHINNTFLVAAENKDGRIISYMLQAVNKNVFPNAIGLMGNIECGMRFLTDYLQGDTYFKTAYADHNLVRCRTQLDLVRDMNRHWDEIKAIVKKYI